jgi:hypothetical protein
MAKQKEGTRKIVLTIIVGILVISMLLYYVLTFISPGY